MNMNPDTLSINTHYPLKTEVDVLAALLADKRSENTKRAYAQDLQDFFLITVEQQPTPALVSQFLQLGRFEAISLVLRYKATLIERGLAESTVNRRLAAIKSLVNYARRVGKCDWSLQDIQGEKVKSYRDTTGVDRDTYRRVLSIPDRDTLKGKRDYALLRLLWENALRRGEVVKADVGDFDYEGRSLMIYGKGQGTQATGVSLSVPTVEALMQWLQARGNPERDQPLFTALDRACYGHRLTGTGLYKLVQKICHKAGIQKRMSPHRIRHAGITEALEITGGDVRAVQKLSRHAKLETLMVYDDARTNAQQKVTELLAAML